MGAKDTIVFNQAWVGTPVSVSHFPAATVAADTRPLGGRACSRNAPISAVMTADSVSATSLKAPPLSETGERNAWRCPNLAHPALTSALPALCRGESGRTHRAARSISQTRSAAPSPSRRPLADPVVRTNPATHSSRLPRYPAAAKASRLHPTRPCTCRRQVHRCHRMDSKEAHTVAEMGSRLGGVHIWWSLQLVCHKAAKARWSVRIVAVKMGLPRPIWSPVCCPPMDPCLSACCPAIRYDPCCPPVYCPMYCPQLMPMPPPRYEPLPQPGSTPQQPQYSTPEQQPQPPSGFYPPEQQPPRFYPQEQQPPRVYPPEQQPQPPSRFYPPPAQPPPPPQQHPQQHQKQQQQQPQQQQQQRQQQQQLQQQQPLQQQRYGPAPAPPQPYPVGYCQCDPWCCYCPCYSCDPCYPRLPPCAPYCCPCLARELAPPASYLPCPPPKEICCPVPQFWYQSPKGPPEPQQRSFDPYSRPLLSAPAPRSRYANPSPPNRSYDSLQRRVSYDR